MDLDENKKIPFDKHYEHHTWVEERKLQDKKDAERADKIKTSIISSIVVAITLGIGSIVIEWFKKGGN